MIFKKSQYIRDEIEAAIKKLNILENDCKEVGKHQWKSILNKIEEVFISKRLYKVKLYWYWELLKNQSYSINFISDNAYLYLDMFVSDEEKIWFLAQETSYKQPKFWIYEGNIKSIQNILSECSHFEYYLVSKKFLWLLCENHHGYLIGAGANMINNMKKIEEKLSEDIIFRNGM